MAKNAPKYQPEKWNDGKGEKYFMRMGHATVYMYVPHLIQNSTNCYAYAFDYKKNPINGSDFISNNNYLGVWGLQPGMLDKNYDQFKSVITSNYVICEVLKDMKLANRKFLAVTKKNKRKYDSYVNRSYIVSLAIKKYEDYHWYRLDRDGRWSHKPGIEKVKKTGKQGRQLPTEINNGYKFISYFYLEKR